MRKLFIGLIILGVIAFVTNPDETKHREAVKKEIGDFTADENDGALAKVGKALGGGLADLAVNTTIKRENRYVYSATKISIAGEEKIIGYGLFGFVFINRDALKSN